MDLQLPPTLTLGLENGQPAPRDSLDLEVHVISMEENYARYFDRVLGSSSIDAARAGFGIDGAVGVFGAVATTVLPLKIVFDCSVVEEEERKRP